MKLGKLKALWLCWELWNWLAKTGKNKINWPEWGKYDVHESCFACEYRNQTKGQCSKCVVPVLRGEDNCNWNGRPYGQWKQAKTPNLRKKYARIIANSAYREYKKLGGKKVK